MLLGRGAYIYRAIYFWREILFNSFLQVGKTWKLEDARLVVIVSSTTGDGEQPEVKSKKLSSS